MKRGMCEGGGRRERIQALRREIQRTERLEVALENGAAKDEDLVRRAMFDASRVIPKRMVERDFVAEKRTLFPLKPRVKMIQRSNQNEEKMILPRAKKVTSRKKKSKKKRKIKAKPPRKLPSLEEVFENQNKSQDVQQQREIDALWKEAMMLGQLPRLAKTRKHLKIPGSLLIDRISCATLKLSQRMSLGVWKESTQHLVWLETCLDEKVVISMQKRFRGQRGRRKVTAMKRHLRERQLAASIRIRKAWARFKASIVLQQRIAIAQRKRIVIIQKAWRGARCRRRQWNLLRQRSYTVARWWLNRGKKTIMKGQVIPGLSPKGSRDVFHILKCFAEMEKKRPGMHPRVFVTLLHCFHDACSLKGEEISQKRDAKWAVKDRRISQEEIARQEREIQRVKIKDMLNKKKGCEYEEKRQILREKQETKLQDGFQQEILQKQLVEEAKKEETERFTANSLRGEERREEKRQKEVERISAKENRRKEKVRLQVSILQEIEENLHARLEVLRIERAAERGRMNVIRDTWVKKLIHLQNQRPKRDEIRRIEAEMANLEAKEKSRESEFLKIEKQIRDEIRTKITQFQSQAP